jgi:23S rRNA pseudouridine1911/1915/1917 synthase
VTGRAALPSARGIEFTVTAAEAGVRLDALLAARPEVASRADAQRLIELERVSVDGHARPKSHRVDAGERIEADVDESGADTPPAAPGARPVPYRLVHEDDSVLVVDKPPGVVVHPGHGHADGTLAQALAGRTAGGPPERRGLAHRLDRDTSGLLVFARTEEAHRALVDALRRRAVRREYVTLVAGVPDARSGTIDAPLGRGRVDRTRVSTSTDRPRAARTRFSVRAAHARTALLDVTLETGRTHQVRVHLAGIGHPVCGDPRYGGVECGRRLALDRQFLHAARLGLEHPVTGEPLELESPLPPDLIAALERARAEPGEGV